jgi:hypothetical protein
MRASELFGLQVFDRTGKEVGEVHDVRAIREHDGPGAERIVVEGLVVGPGSVGVRLGYGHGRTKGPWLLRVLFRRRAIRARFVPWHAIATRTDKEVRLAIDAAELPPENDE